MSNALSVQLANVCTRRGNAIALSAPGYPDIDYITLAGSLQALHAALDKAGLVAGLPVAFPANNEPATALLALALLTRGVAIPVNPDLRSHELDTMFASLPPAALLIPDGNQPLLRERAAAHGIPVCDIRFDHWRAESLAGTQITRPGWSAVLPPATSMILQTSGSTAEPRRVPVSHDALMTSARALIDTLQLNEQDRCLHMLPLYHIGGLLDVLIAPLLAGGRVIFTRGFDPRLYFELCQQHSPTWTQTVPAMLAELVERAPDQGACKLRFIRSVSAPLPARLAQGAARVFATAIVEIYGMTETAGVITSQPLDPSLQRPGSVGVSAGTQIRIVDDAGLQLPPGLSGEIQLRGSSVMPGYLTPDGLDGSIIHDGWLRTGDIGRQDEAGYLYLEGRLKDIINRGGEKIAPMEIDQLVLQHPDVQDAASIPVPDERLGERVALAVVPRLSGGLTADGIEDYLKSRLAYFKLPDPVLLVDAIPRHHGKLRRRELAALLRTEDRNTTTLHEPTDDQPLATGDTAMAALWAEILEVERVSSDADFFYLGGNSLLVTVLINTLNERWDMQVALSTLYDHPELAQFCEALRERYPTHPCWGNTE